MSSFNSMLFLLPFLILPICFGQENPVKVDCTHPSFLCPLNTYCIPQLGLCQPTNQQNNQSTSSPTFPPFTPSNQFGIQCGDKTCQNGEICVRSSTTNMGPAVPAAGGGQQPPQQEQQQCVKFNSQPCYQFGRPVFCAPGQFCFYQQENQQLQEAYCVSLEDQQSTNCDNQQQPNEQ